MYNIAKSGPHDARCWRELRANIRKERILHIRSEAPSAQSFRNSICSDLVDLMKKYQNRWTKSLKNLRTRIVPVKDETLFT
ncbi:hypothetical protein BpHYR1_025829 [Brachionus plicatilis]|uniref:Uncharacterized protein n=1 Tax=Brachionus plicatilis TaxID=10195 RepID=A0A3M7R9K8_BRAPC|nr:hypothetical protein BpHYR1_025829 [Brachionus plicatilis]